MKCGCEKFHEPWTVVSQVACPTCDACPGERCRTSTGRRKTYVHRAREHASDKWERERARTQEIEFVIETLAGYDLLDWAGDDWPQPHPLTGRSRFDWSKYE